MTSIDLADFRAAAGAYPVRCTVALLLQQLDADQAARLSAALAADDIQHAAIVRVVDRWGHRLGYDAVKRHRKGDCRCG